MASNLLETKGRAVANWFGPLCGILLLGLLSSCTDPVAEQELAGTSALTTEKTNFLVILVDDLGYSDIEPFGGEIPTPNLAALANSGTRFTNFHTAVKCNPTRAMLMTGLDNNLAASGPRSDYQLRPEIPTIAERLSELGYHSYMAGKWDNGSDDGEWPSQRGFERSFVLLPGAGTHFLPLNAEPGEVTPNYLEDGAPVILPEDFYSTVEYTDKIIEFIDSNLGDDKPFFAYLGYTAPHYPLQAPKEYIDRFDGWYSEGYQVLREQRIQRMREMQLINQQHQTWQAPALSSWDELTEEEQIYEAKRMQIYAAMVSLMDEQIGRVLDYLDEKDIAKNTLVIFSSDNGADGTTNGVGMNDSYNNDLSNLGSQTSYITQGLNWAKVSSTPFRLVKTYPTEGGTRAAMISRWPQNIPAGQVSEQWIRISDIAPTFLEIAGMPVEDWPTPELSNNALDSMVGRSVLDSLITDSPAYQTAETRIHTYIENRLGGANVLSGDWKLVWWKENGQYVDPMLFNLAEDSMETTDLAALRPDIVAQLTAEWRAYGEQIGEPIEEANPQ